MTNRIGLIVLMMLASATAIAQKYTVESYIDEFKYIAIEEMDKTGIPASITLAQGILESRYGNSELALASNNHFGIKCHTGWTGKSHYYDDDRRNECFRVYKNPEQSYRDHSDFLLTRSRYEFLFEYASTDYKSWAHGLKKAGYATNPKYGNLLIDLIERHQLYLYDRPDRNMIARNRHDDRHNDQKVEASGNYKVNDHKVLTTPVRPASAEHIVSYNRIRAVAVGKYDDLRSIAERNYLAVNRLMKYNDLETGDAVSEGMILYLQPKRNRAEHKTHVVKEGETMWMISQLNGVKLSKLYGRNHLEKGEEPAAGQIVHLNGKAPSKPVLRRYDPSQPEPKPAAKEEVGEMVIAPARPVPSKVDERTAVQAGTETTDSANGPTAMTSPERNADTAAAASGPETPRGADPVASSNRKVHIVKKGDTLYSISKLYEIGLEQLKTWNNLPSNLISIDQILIVSE